jgi:Tfp pilus assembly protein PilN
MQKAIAEEQTLNTPADYEATIEQCLAEMKRLQEQRDRDQTEIDRLKAETQAILAKLKAASQCLSKSLPSPNNC